MEDKRITEALELLNSVAKDKKNELEQVISNKFGDFKSLVEGVAGKVKHQAVDSYEISKEKIEDVLSEVDKSVHKNPWPYIGGTAAVALLLGYLLGRSRD
jgi:ElaB/YqjD/DUF883 family membrane-anchored ribosome-binding protein